MKPVPAALLFLTLTLAAARSQSPAPASPPAGPSTNTAKPDDDFDDLHYLDVQVIRRDNGEPVTRISPRDFRVLENGFTHPVRRVTVDRWPLSVVLLVNTGKDFQPALAPIAKDIDLALQKLRPKDEVSVIAFNETSELLQEFTTDRKAVAAKFFQLTDPLWQKKLGKKTDADQALRHAGELMNGAKANHRRVVIVFSQETLFSWWPQFKADKAAYARDVLRSGSAICGVMLSKEMSGFSRLLTLGAPVWHETISPTPVNTQPLVRVWAERTGGEVFGGDRLGLAPALARLFERLHQRVLVGFIPIRPERDVSFRSLDLEVSSELEDREGPVEVRVREGYFAPAAPRPTPTPTPNPMAPSGPMQVDGRR
ncbi:MAG: VWA domain-containing protein [Blastocatellia bacterium]